MSMSKKPDPRTVRSKKMIKEAVIELLNENPDISSLTVQKISNHAELNRATFYLHFDDINHLLKQLVQDIFDDLTQKVKPLLEVENLKNDDKLLAFLDYFYLNRKLLAVLFELPRFKKKLHEVLKEFIQMRKRGIIVQDELASLDLIAASLMGVISWWIKDGTFFSSEYIANQISIMYQKDLIQND